MTTAHPATRESFTTPPLREPSSTPLSRLRSLGKAEWLQFIRNRTLLLMLAFPALFGIGFFALTKPTGGTLFAAGTAIEIVTLTTLAFVVYYSVLSMATTRRDEKVLKRLRTGEATDLEILSSLAIPGSLATLALVAVTSVLIWLLGAPVPVNVVPILVAVVLGTIVSWGLALLTSTITQNAEAAQMTSLPVILLIMLSQGSLRSMFSEDVQRILDLTPFAAISDLAQLGWTGNTFSALSAGEPALGFVEVLATSAVPTLALIVWSALFGWVGVTYLKWDTHRG